MVQRIYIDTSVIGGYFDAEFEFYTRIFFSKVFEGKFKMIISDILTTELDGAPKIVRDFYHTMLTNQVEFVEQTEDSIKLADNYLKEGVVGRTSRTDCRHIALATLANADILVSWNFKHIVNIARIRGFNSVNLRTGFKTIEIRTPREIIEL